MERHYSVNKKKIEISECLSNSLGQSAVGSNTKINIKETDQLDVFNGPFDLEPLSNSQLQNTISDLQSSPARCFPTLSPS
jgi:hypothetical protein